MYTRTYSDDHHGILIPDSYGGTTFTDGLKFEQTPPEEKESATRQEETEDVSGTPTTAKKASTSLDESKSHLFSFLPNILNFSNFSLQNLGKEEVLIIAAAIFLFLSKEGDKELAIMLILLLFLG